MAVDVNTYVIYGIKLPYKSIAEDTREMLLERFGDSATLSARKWDEMTFLSDGMNGEYIILGFVLARGDDNGGAFADPVSLPTGVTADLIDKSVALHEIFGSAHGTAAGWHVVSHYR